MSNTPHRIALIGPGGSGKTTLATALSDRLGLPLIDETFRTARRLVARSNAPDKELPRLEQETGLIHQVDWEVRYRDSGYVSDRSIYDYMIYSDLRGCTWPADHDPLREAAERWWREVGGYTLVVYVPPYSNAPPECDGFRYVDPEFVERERRAFLTMSMRSHVHSLWSVCATTPADRLEEIMSAIHYWTDPAATPLQRHEGCLAGVHAAREVTQ